ncbi:MAG: SLC13 family permease [Trueperaceae bacterium]|nr:SLC13 family permease [Trueperaceae bacterium]
MSLEIMVVFALLLLALVLFALEFVRVDVTAIIVMAVLLLSGILTPEEGLRGFSNVATVTVGAMFVLSAGLRQTGALSGVGNLFRRLGQRNYVLALVVMMLMIGVVSAFINNTAAVAIFIPIVLSVSGDLKVSPSKLLIPLSFASMFGGVCTLIGTSTNLLVSSIAQNNGIRPFGVFEFAPLGVVFFVVGFIYLYFGMKLVPARRKVETLTESFEMKDFLTDVVIGDDAPYVGEQLSETTLSSDLDLDILEVYRGDESFAGINPQVRLRAGDRLRVRGSVTEIGKLLTIAGITLSPTGTIADTDVSTERDTLIEVVIGPESELIQKTVGEVDFPQRFGAQVLALRQHGQLQQEDLKKVTLQGGNALLLKIDRERLAQLRQEQDFVIASEESIPEVRENKIPIAVATIVGVVGLAVLGVVPIVVSAIAGCLVMVLSGCLSVNEAYRAIQWKVMFLLAGILSLGVAMEKTGAAQLLSDVVVGGLEPFGPVAILSAFFLLSQLLTEIISNNATAALLAPIAIATADSLGLDARPFLFAVTFAASLSFMTPIGYQTNTLVYGPGQYRFTDFTRVGAPLNIIFWILGTLLIPRIWSF